MARKRTAGQSNKRRGGIRAVMATALVSGASMVATAAPANAATTASFGAGVLSVFGDNLDNNVSVSRNAEPRPWPIPS